MSLNTIANVSLNLKAKISYEIPDSGTFLFIWSFREMPFSATYQWRNGELAVMTDCGWEIAGSGIAEEFYPIEDMKRIAAGGDTATKFIAVVVVEI